MLTEKDNGRRTFAPTTHGMKEYATFIDENHGGGGSGGSDDYNDLAHKPSINGHVLAGTQTSKDLGLAGLQAVQAYATMPTGYAGLTVMYVGEDTAEYVKGRVYRFSGTAWTEIYAPSTGGDILTISNAEIDALF